MSEEYTATPAYRINKWHFSTSKEVAIIKKFGYKHNREHETLKNRNAIYHNWGHRVKKDISNPFRKTSENMAKIATSFQKMSL